MVGIVCSVLARPEVTMLGALQGGHRLRLRHPSPSRRATHRPSLPPQRTPAFVGATPPSGPRCGHGGLANRGGRAQLGRHENPRGSTGGVGGSSSRSDVAHVDTESSLVAWPWLLRGRTEQAPRQFEGGWRQAAWQEEQGCYAGCRDQVALDRLVMATCPRQRRIILARMKMRTAPPRPPPRSR